MYFNSAFVSLVGISIGIMSFLIGLKICAITAGIKNISPFLKKEREGW